MCNSSPTRLHNVSFLFSYLYSVGFRILRPRISIVVCIFCLFFLKVLRKGEKYLIEGIVIESLFKERKSDLDFLYRENSTSLVIDSPYIGSGRERGRPRISMNIILLS